MKKIVLLLSILCIVPSISLAQFSRSVVLPTNGRTLTEQLEVERLEAEKKAQEEAEKERKKQEEIARQKAEEARIEAEKKAEQARIEAEKKAEQARLEAERKAEQARKEAEEKAAAERKKLELEAERKRQLEEKARIEAEKKAEEARIEAKKKAEKARIEAERKAEEEKRKAEEARIEAEKKAEKARIEAERKAEEERKKAEEAAERARIKKEEQEKREIEREKARLERKARIEAYPWSNFIMANGGFSSTPDYTFGITYARVKQGGFYVSAMSNFGFKFDSDYRGGSDGSLYGEYYNDIKGRNENYFYDYNPMYTGKKKHTRMSVTAGGMVRMHIPLYAYAGIGYGYRGVFLETVGNKWVEIHNGNTVYHGVAFEVGLMGNIKGFAISAGFSMLGNLNGIYPEAKIGLGYCF